MSVYVYALKDPETGRTRYIGQTEKPLTRLSVHVSAAKNSRSKVTRLHSWIQEVLKRGFSRPMLEILKACGNRRSATFWEAHFIRQGRDEDLLNINQNPTEPRIPVSAQAAIMAVKGYLTLSAAANALGLTRQTVWAWAQSGKVKYIRVIRHIYVEKESLIAHVGEVARDLLPGATSGST